MGTVAETFMDALIARDFDRLAGCLAPDAQARLLLPRGAEEILGRAPIRARIEGWFGTAAEFDLLYSSLDAVGARQRLNWRFHVVRDGQSAETIEQVLFVDEGPEGLQRLDLLCSGFHPAGAAPEACDVNVFDAGAMGCADGLAQEFRRRIESLPVGASLAVVVGDPAAKEDLPPLARMLGHAVKSTQALDDGRLTITVERRK